jgi:hypothetical protein
MLIARGEHPKTIQLRFGHPSLQVSLDTYGHLFQDADDAGADRLDAGYLETFGDFLAFRASTYSPANRQNPELHRLTQYSG